MIILFVGVFNDTSTNNSLADSLDKTNDVHRYNYRQRAEDLGDISKRDNDLCSVINLIKPQLTVFAKCNNMSCAPVDEANKHGLTCLWYMDPQNDNYNDELIEKIHACSFACFALDGPYNHASQIKDQTYLIPEGFDSLIDRPISIPWDIDVSFIGDMRGDREDYVRSVNAHNFNNAYGHEHAVAVSRSKINLNFTQGGTSDRTYKVLAAGGFLLTQPWPTIDDQFIVHRHLVTFDGLHDLRKKILYYLTHDEERKQIAHAGYEHNKMNSRMAWATNILDIYTDLRTQPSG